jgi:hypothetical protein
MGSLQLLWFLGLISTFEPVHIPFLTAGIMQVGRAAGFLYIGDHFPDVELKSRQSPQFIAVLVCGSSSCS